MSKMIIKTEFIALVVKHIGETSKTVTVMAESKEDALRQLDWCFEVIWVKPNGVRKSA